MSKRLLWIQVVLAIDVVLTICSIAAFFWGIVAGPVNGNYRHAYLLMWVAIVAWVVASKITTYGSKILKKETERSNNEKEMSLIANHILSQLKENDTDV